MILWVGKKKIKAIKKKKGIKEGHCDEEGVECSDVEKKKDSKKNALRAEEKTAGSPEHKPGGSLSQYDAQGKPKLHLHASFGRARNPITGCIRMGVDVWRIGEVIMIELNDGEVTRVKDKETGFEFLEVGS